MPDPFQHAQDAGVRSAAVRHNASTIMHVRGTVQTDLENNFVSDEEFKFVTVQERGIGAQHNLHVRALPVLSDVIQMASSVIGHSYRFAAIEVERRHNPGGGVRQQIVNALAGGVPCHVPETGGHWNSRLHRGSTGTAGCSAG